MERVMKTLRFPKNLIDEIDSISAVKKTNFTDFITTAARSLRSILIEQSNGKKCLNYMYIISMIYA